MVHWLWEEGLRGVMVVPEYFLLPVHGNLVVAIKLSTVALYSRYRKHVPDSALAPAMWH
jgi:hypothetical protein